MSPKNITRRICIEKVLPHHQDEFNKINSGKYEHTHRMKLQAAFFSKKIWPKNSKIIIAFLDNGDNIRRTSYSASDIIDPLQKKIDEEFEAGNLSGTNMTIIKAVKKIVNERIIPLVDIDIKFIDNVKKANVRVSFDPNGGAWSLVGTDHLEKKSGATINLGWFDVATTIHEFCHMLGMIHEHQNPNNEKGHIHWDKPALFEYMKNTQGWTEATTNTNIINKYDKSTINGSDFDPLSIMLYFFPQKLTTNGVGTKQNLKYSGLDVLWIHNTYPKQGGLTAEEFYKNVYNISLKSSIEASQKALAKFNKPDSLFNIKTIGIILSVILTIIFIIFIIIWISKSSKGKRKTRYG